VSLRQELEAGTVPRWGTAVDIARMMRELPAGDWVATLVAEVYWQGHHDGESCAAATAHAIVEESRSWPDLLAGLRRLADDPGLEPAQPWEEERR
jgi:hypothetical protein